MKPWIEDSGAPNHMTRDINLLHRYSPCHENLTVKIGDGSISKVAGTSSIIISADLMLYSILHVPKPDCNLLSVSKLNQQIIVLLNFIQNCVNFRIWFRGEQLAVLRCAPDFIFL